jgi:AcrR family transcriptional regulator
VQLSPSRRERKKQATRQALHEAAFALAEEHGLAGVTVEAIADRADVAPRTFFNYFACKEDAILDRDPERLERFRDELLNRPPDEDALTALRAVMEAEAARRAVDADRSLRRMRLIRGEPQLQSAMAGVSEEMERALIGAVAERTGQAADDLYPALLVTETWGALKVAHMHWSEHGGTIPYQQVLAEAFDTLARGLVPEPRPRRRPPERKSR